MDSVTSEEPGGAAQPSRSGWPRPSKAFLHAVKRQQAPDMTRWPQPLGLERVVVERALLRFITEILASQAPTAPVGAVTLRPCREREKKCAH